MAFQERAGASVKHEAKAEPLRRKSCQREECFACTTSGNGRCEKNGAGYRIECLTCQMDGRSAIYEGETSRNAFTRGMEHLDAIRLQDEDNALWKHCLVVHDGIEAQFSMQVVGVYRTPLVRQVNESVRIIISKAECVMNSKSEWHQAPIVRIIPMSGLQEEQGAGRGSLQQPGEAGRGGGAGRGGIYKIPIIPIS